MKHKHLLTLPYKSQSRNQLSGSFEVHNFVFDCIVGCFDASVLLLEGIADDTLLKRSYLAMSLERMFSPSLIA